MGIMKAFGGRKPGDKGPKDAENDNLPPPATALALSDTLEDAVGAAFATPEVPRPDPLLNVLQYLARRWGRPLSRDVLTAGLPLKNGLLTFALMPRALERIGLVVQPKRVALRD